MWYDIARRILFRLDPETAHRLALEALKTAYRGRVLPLLVPSAAPAERRVMGLTFPSPVGLAAGMDKNGDYINALGGLGFGFIELGTVTPRPQPGNPKPRLFRIPAARALVNRMGFNNRGVAYLVEKVRLSGFRGILGINIGKNVDTPVQRAVDDYLICLRKVYPYASYVAVNISSPNTPGLRALQYGEALEELLRALMRERSALAAAHGRPVPLAVKIAPDITAEEIGAIADAMRRHAIDAIIATNTTLSRVGVAGLPQADEPGGLSGAPLLARANEVVSELRRATRGEIPLVGVGGIMSAADALAKTAAGADLVQIYTGFVYRGPALIQEIVATLR
jgi:dihydroorotate dehydrogenase